VIGPFIGIDTPVTVMQMLWINMVMDTLAGLAFSGEPPLDEYMHEQPKKRDENIINGYMLSEILITGAYIILLCLAFLKIPLFSGFIRRTDDGIYFMTAFFALFMFITIFNSFNARTQHQNLFSSLNRNPMFIIVMGIICAVQIGLLYFGGALFRTASLTLRELLICILLALSVIPVDLLRKQFLQGTRHKAQKTNGIASVSVRYRTRAGRRAVSGRPYKAAKKLLSAIFYIVIISAIGILFYRYFFD
jgi:magnesium-transporting ATPase (P-type)